MRTLLLAIGLCLNLLGGCTQKPEPAPNISISEAQKKFEQKCHDEFDLHVMTKQAGSTLYIYTTTQDPLFDYEAKKENSETSEAKPSKFALPYLDGTFTGDHFTFEYDVVKRTKTKAEDLGYGSTSSDTYSKTQNNIYTAITDSFFNIKPKPDEQEPKFIVIIVTDIKKGVEVLMTCYLEDLKRTMTGELPYDEYSKRYLQDVKGGQKLIGDEVGSHIDFTDIKMADFLAKQIVNRINFKFTRSDFGPDDEYDKTVAGIIADTLRYYHFEDFKDVELSNLRQEKKFTYDKDALKTFGDDLPGKAPSDGKLIHIRFDNGKATFNE